MNNRAGLGLLITAGLALGLAVAPPATASVPSDADRAIDAFVDAFWDPAKNYFFTNSDHVIDPGHAYGPEDGLYTDFWWEAQLWETLMDTYERTGDSTHREMIDDIYDGFAAYYPDFENNFNDDIGWWAQGAIRAYGLTGDCRYLERSKGLFAGIWAEWDDTYGGGIWWRKDPRDQKNVATNAPAAITAVRLYQATGEDDYLDKAEELFDWVDTHLHVDGHVYDHLEGPGDGTLVKWDFTYNPGNYIGAAVALFEATDDSAYLEKAIAAADWVTTHLTNGGTFNYEGLDDGAGFKTVLIRHLTRLATVHEQTQYLPLLQANVTQAWDHRRTSDDLVGANWSAPTEEGRIQSLTAAAAVSALQVVPFNGYTGLQPGTGIYDAENAVTTQLGAESSSEGFLGRGYLAGWNDHGQAVTFHVNTAAAGGHELRLRYAAAAGEATRRVLVNGVEVADNHRFPGTGSWSTWAETDLDNVDLVAGHNTIRVEYSSSSGSSQYLNFDRLTVSRQLEAEDGTVHNVGVESNPNDHTGTGYLAGWNGSGQWVDLEHTVEKAGRYDVTLRYAAGAGDASRYIYVNGTGVVENQAFPGTASWNAWQTVTIPDVPLVAGANTLSIIFEASNGSQNWLNLDHLTLRYVHDEPGAWEPPAIVPPRTGTCGEPPAEVARWVAQDQADPVADDSILFVGSSSIRRWESVTRDFADYNVIQRGWGGSHLSGVIDYAPWVVLPYDPSAIVMWAGTNDIRSGKSPQTVLADFQTFVSLVHADHPATEVFYISITPTPDSAWIDAVRQETNGLIAAAATANPKVHYIDIASHFEDLQATDPGTFHDLYLDGLHLSPAGYAEWVDIVRPALESVIAPNKSVTPNPSTLQSGDALLFDFGPSNTLDGDPTGVDERGHNWNNWVPTDGGGLINSGEHITGLVDTTGRDTGIGMTITGGFLTNGKRNGGLQAPNGPTTALLGDFAVQTATQDYFFSSADGKWGGGDDDVAGGLMLTGLDPSHEYEFRFFGSRDTAETRITEYAVYGTDKHVMTLQTSGTGIGSNGTYNGNDDEIAVVSGVRPDAFGQAWVDVTLVQGAFAHLNALEIVASSAGPGPLAISSTSEVRCLAGKGYVAVRAQNDDTAVADVTIATPYGTRAFAHVQPGTSVFHSFTTRAGSIPAGTATVSAEGDGRSGEVDVAYAEKSCG